MKRLLLLLLMLSLLTGCMASASGSEYDLTFTAREMSGEWDEKSAVTITGLAGGRDISGKGASFSGDVLTISRAGVYVFTGQLGNMQILVNAGSKNKVQIVLNGVEFACDNGPAILIEEADKVFITAADGTENTIADGAAYASADYDGAIFSKTDLCLNGSGVLTVKGQYKHGIVSKDDLVLAGLTLNVEAVSTALDGKDCVKMAGVSGTINAGSNAIRSDNAEDAGRGFIYLKDSTLLITAGGDGVDAATLLKTDNAVLTITTGEGSGTGTQSSSDFGGSWGGRGGSWGGWGSASSSSDESSCKGLKAGKSLELDGGAFVIDAQDDAIHSNGDLAISSGLFTLKSGDDGIHADNELVISGGEILIEKSYEGIEASKLTISGGKIEINASDDGLNAAGGTDDAEDTNSWRWDRFSSLSGEIYITGGYIHINADGDGIDSNNTILVSGGVTLVSGSPSSGNAAFDYDGEASVTGGILIAVGGSGMAQSFSSAENQGSMLFGINGAQAGTNIAIVNSDNLVVASYTPEDSYSAVVVTAPGLQVGNTYSVVMGATIEGADDHGFAADAAYTGGTNIGSIEMTQVLQGGSGHSMGGGAGGGRPGGGRGW